jgi:hypothetical protein
VKLAQPRRRSPTARLMVAAAVVALIVLAFLLAHAGTRFAGSAWKQAKAAAHAKEKHLRFDDLLARGWVTVHLDSRRPGVRLPERFMGAPDFRLQYGRDMPRPIPDLATTDEGVTATLSFDGQPQPTHVPWTAVFLITDRKGRGRWYREDTPAEAVPQMEQSQRGAEPPPRFGDSR